MKMNKTLAGILMAGALALGGCGGSTSVEKSNDPTLNYKVSDVLIGNPLGFGMSYGKSAGDIAIAIETDDGVVCVSHSGNYLRKEYSRAEALVESEINDGDQENITLRGVYDNDEFKMRSLTANGHTVRF